MAEVENTASALQEYKYANSKHLIFNLDGRIEEPEKYREFFRAAEVAGEDDRITLMINSGGGRVDSLIQILSVLELTKAETECNVFYAASAATFIALACDNIMFAEHSYMMFHNIQAGHVGDTCTGERYYTFLNSLSEKLMDKYYAPVLTKKERKELSQGDVEIYKHGEEVLSKILAHNKRKEKANKDEAK